MTAPDTPYATESEPMTAEHILTASGGRDALNALPDAEPAGKGPSQASLLVALAEDSYRVFFGTDARPYAVPKAGPMITLSLRGKDGLRSRLARAFYRKHHTAAGGSALTDALAVLEGAASESEPEPVALRVATAVDGSIVLDLGTVDGRCVVIDDTGWRIEPSAPVLFRRSALTAPLPTPYRNGSLDPLRALLNVPESGFRLIVGWLVAALLPDIPHPILALTGEQGTAKSTAARLAVCLIDPSPAPLRSAPRDVKQWAVTASASWTVALDNISTIPAWLSDTLCKAVTGDGLVDRALFTDDDVTVLAFRRVIAMTSIDPGALAGDLAERLLPVELSRIDPTNRRSDAEIMAAYDKARPAVLGALLDLLANVLATLPTVQLDQLPRMADFTRVLAALDTVTGWSTVADYTHGAADITESVIESDPFADAVRRFARRGYWRGTTAALLRHITPDVPPRAWPKTPAAAGGALRRIAPALRESGVTLEFARTENGRYITLTTEGTGTSRHDRQPRHDDHENADQT